MAGFPLPTGLAGPSVWVRGAGGVAVSLFTKWRSVSSSVEMRDGSVGGRGKAGDTPESLLERSGQKHGWAGS